MWKACARTGSSSFQGFPSEWTKMGGPAQDLAASGRESVKFFFFVSKQSSR